MQENLTQGINGKGKKLQSRIWFFSLVDDENDIPKIMENMKNSSALNCFAICHDKDKIKQDDGSTVPKRVHYHFALRFENPTLLSVVANICNLQVCDYHLIQKSKNWRSSCRYMLHLDQKDKYLYNIKDLEVLKGEKDDYYNVAIGKAQVVTTDADLFPDFGNFDKIGFRQQYLDIYKNIDEPKRRNLLLKELELSWKNYIQKRRYEMEHKNVKVIFVDGAAGTGKSTFAKSLAINNKKSYCISSSSNDIMQDYTCEDYLILDDLRDTSFSFEDLLKLLDNYVISSVKSRYNNKLFLGEYIVITSAKPLCEWYKDTSEDRQQLFRRISMFARCRKNGDALIADLYIPRENEKVIDENGNPNGKRIPTPILNLSQQDVISVECQWKELGIDINKIGKEAQEKFQKSCLEDTEDDIPF